MYIFLLAIIRCAAERCFVRSAILIWDAAGFAREGTALSLNQKSEISPVFLSYHGHSIVRKSNRFRKNFLSSP